MPLDPKLLYNIAPSVAAAPATLGALVYKAWASVPEHNEQFEQAFWSATFLFCRWSDKTSERE